MPLSPRRLRSLCLAVFVLPVLLLRAAVPAGFMAASVDGALQIVLCPAQAMGAHHAHHHAGHDPAHSAVDPTCPYAQSAGPALMPALPLLPRMAVMHRLDAPAAFTQTQFALGPPRRQFPRGPPILA